MQVDREKGFSPETLQGKLKGLEEWESLPSSLACTSKVRTEPSFKPLWLSFSVKAEKTVEVMAGFMKLETDLRVSTDRTHVPLQNARY